jgi:hypothetical protein
MIDVTSKLMVIKRERAGSIFNFFSCFAKKPIAKRDTIQTKGVHKPVQAKSSRKAAEAEYPIKLTETAKASVMLWSRKSLRIFKTVNGFIRVIQANEDQAIKNNAFRSMKFTHKNGRLCQKKYFY